ncbi:MAG TPA: glycosyltransferase family 4 protein [Chloroflexota bacterium]|nr:glycosyltransferase family 4 protein [Chloroflexota bacterium]
MNICVTHYAYHPVTGGVETHLVDLCSELANQGHEVHALVGSLPGQPDEQYQNGVWIHRRPELDIEQVRKRKQAAGIDADIPWSPLQQEIRAFYRDFIDRFRIDLVHAHNFHHFLPEYALALTELHDAGVPTVLTIHEMWGEFICEHLLENTRWDAIIAVGEHVRRDVVRMVPGIRNLHTVLHGTNLQAFHPGVVDGGLRAELGLIGRPVILHPARMLPWKGVHVSVAAMRRVIAEFPEAALIITDTDQIIDWIRELGAYKQEILDTIQRDGLGRNVIPRSFDYFDLPRAYALADIVIYPTTGEEPFGLVPLEAMACARPVIVSRSGGLVESVVDGVTGYIIPKEDPEALADRILHLLRDDALRRRMGQAGRQHVERHFSRQRMADQTVALYQAALAAGRERAVHPPVAGMRSGR